MKSIFSENLDSSGKMFRKNYLEKYFTSILEEIQKYVIENGLDDLPFKQQVYHWYNDIKNIVICECGNFVKFKNSNIGYYTFCSKKCMNKSNHVKNKRMQTCLDKFGTKTPSENILVKEKIIKTNIKKYGYNSPIQNEEIHKKSLKTLKDNYNVSSPLKSVEIYNRYKETCLSKYGVDNVSKLDLVKIKRQRTMKEKYGVIVPLHNIDLKDRMIKSLRKTIMNKYLKYYEDYDVISLNLEEKKYLMMCEKGHEFEISYVLLNSRRRSNTLLCTKCNPILKSVSGLEIDFLNYIKSNYDKTILNNKRNIIKPLELDIYLPDLKLAFEFNGLYWHNELYKSDRYHLNKTEKCEEKDIQLIHIYEDDWKYKQNIVKSMILNKLGKTPNKIYARKTQIKEINDNKLIREFLDNNHIQGFVGSSVKLGLYYENELVSLMTFGKNRLGIGVIKKYDFELLRFCNKLNTNIVGGASKLFKYFIKNYDPKKIVSYADRSWSKGNLYDNLNFNRSHTTKPGYHYIVDGVRRHRYNYRKQTLVKDGYDANRTEHDIMLERGIYRINNSGHICFEWGILKNGFLN